MPANSRPYPNVPEAAITGFGRAHRAHRHPGIDAAAGSSVVQLELHDDGILARAVVAAPDPEVAKAELPVEPPRRDVARPHLEEHGPGARRPPLGRSPPPPGCRPTPPPRRD